MKNLFQMLVVIYSSICLVGCVTSNVIEYAEETAETVSRYWSVENITFAAIRDNRFVRMCIEFRSPTDSTEAELSIDLNEITEQLNAQSSAISRFEDGINTESSTCSLELEDNERVLPILVTHSDASDISDALHQLGQETYDELVINLLRHETENYLVFGVPVGMHEGLDKYALDSYTQIEKHFRKSIILLLPLALAVDAAIIVVMVILIILCAIPILLPLCFPMALVVEGFAAGINNELPESESEDLFEDMEWD